MGVPGGERPFWSAIFLSARAKLFSAVDSLVGFSSDAGGAKADDPFPEIICILLRVELQSTQTFSFGRA